MALGFTKAFGERKSLWTRLSETAVILAAAGGMYWSGQMAMRMSQMEHELRQLPAIATNVLLLCRAAPEVQCVDPDAPREEHAALQSIPIRPQ